MRLRQFIIPLLVIFLSAMAPWDGIEKRPLLVLFYRDDCAPCHAEIKMLRAFENELSNWSVAIVSLGGNPKNLAKNVQVVMGDDALLRRYNDKRLALPFSLAFDKDNNECGRRTGVLGLDIIKDWQKSCSPSKT